MLLIGLGMMIMLIVSTGNMVVWIFLLMIAVIMVVSGLVIMVIIGSVARV